MAIWYRMDRKPRDTPQQINQSLVLQLPSLFLLLNYFNPCHSLLEEEVSLLMLNLSLLSLLLL